MKRNARANERVVRPASRDKRATTGRSREQVQAYLAGQPPLARRRLRELRAIVRQVVPTAVEDFSYAMPAFRMAGKGLVWYAAWKRHYSLYPISTGTEQACAEELAQHAALSGRGTVRFLLESPAPRALIARLVKARVLELS